MTLESAALNMPANLENPAVATGLEKVSFHSSPKKGNAKEWSNYHKIALISHATKVMLTFLQARLQQYMNHELPDVQAGFRKGRGTRDQIANICWVLKKQESSRKNIYFCLIDYAKVFDCLDHNKLWEILQENLPPYLPPEKCVKKQQLEPDIEQTDSKLGKEYVNVLIFILLI